MQKAPVRPAPSYMCVLANRGGEPKEAVIAVGGAVRETEQRSAEQRERAGLGNGYLSGKVVANDIESG